MRRGDEEELTQLRAVLAQLTDARRKAEWLLEAAAADAVSTKETMAQIAAQLRHESEVAAQRAEQQAELITQLLLDSLAATFPALSARYGDAEARAIVRSVLPALAQEPMITIRAHSTTAAAISHEFGQLDPELSARVETVNSEAMPPGDVRSPGETDRRCAASGRPRRATAAGAGSGPLVRNVNVVGESRQQR